MILKDKVVIVTGVGPGMTGKLCRAAAREGARVVVTARTRSFIEAMAKEIRAEGGAAIAEPVDVSSADDCRRAARRALDEFGRIDGLVNSAFYYPKSVSLIDAEVDQWTQAYDVCCLGAVRMIQAVGPAMRAQKSGSIVNISSMGSRRVRPGNGAYASAKSAMNQVSRAVAVEEGGAGIRCNTIAMGVMMGASLQTLFLDPLSPDDQATTRAQIISGIPLGRIPPDEDCAKAVLFMLSDYASEVTGALLDVNGGEWVAP